MGGGMPVAGPLGGVVLVFLWTGFLYCSMLLAKVLTYLAWSVRRGG